jgi:HAE1 family hydrophobic/amphiphilic exporter-1
MTLADLSVKRPIFITCLVILLIALGFMGLRNLAVDLFPNVTFPIVSVTTVYPGAGPAEVETLVSKVLEDEMSTLPGIKSLRSINNEGVSTVIAEFTLETDIKYAEQQIRDRTGSAKRKLPDDIEEPVIRRIDPADQPILILGLTADLPEAQLFELADKIVRPKVEQVPQVGLVQVIGGREREIHVELDRAKLKAYEISASGVAARISAAGQNIPAGKVDNPRSETVFRTLGEFRSTQSVGEVIVSFVGNDVPVTVSQLGTVKDTVADETSRAAVNGKRGVFLMVFRQSGANTIAVVDAVAKRVGKINEEMKTRPGGGQLLVVRDGAKAIRANVADVKESIFIGIALTILVVYFFLGSGRSTIITGLALPNSLLGAFFLMWIAGFSINVMTLLALSLAVGLLIDDAIVVRENIFRHVEMGKSALKAALEGTQEVGLAVVAVTLAVLSVFAPVGFLQGVVGQFFKEFALTICFAMVISLFDALTIAPMLSAYFAGGEHGAKDAKGLWGRTMGAAVRAFDRGQTRLENFYGRVLEVTLRRPLLTLTSALGIFILSLMATKFVPKTFLPPQDMGEFSVSLEMPPGTSLAGMYEVAEKVDAEIRKNPEVESSVMIVGNSQGEANKTTFFVNMVPSKRRRINTSDFKEKVRQQLKPYAYALPIVKDIDMVGGGQRPFNVNIVGSDLKEVERYANQLFDRLKTHPGLKDVEMSYKPGKPEFQVVPDNRRAEALGVSTSGIGSELRTQIEGATPAVFREAGEEYDIRVRLRADQRNLKEGFESTYVPNINGTLVRLRDVAKPVETTGPANITRQDRGRYIQLAADVAPNGPGLGGVMADINTWFATDLKLPPDMSYKFVGQAENFQELMINMMVAMGLGVLFIFLVLSSLYESFVTPFTIMLVLPLAAAGAFVALLITQHSLDLFSMIGCIMLLGVATKNSILLVDYTRQLEAQGMPQARALIESGKTRLRPILMTTVALIAGMLPIAIGLNEASKQRTSMGIAVIGGLISSTLLTLVVVPAAYSYIERFRAWAQRVGRKLLAPADAGHGDAPSTGNGRHAGAQAPRPELGA